MVAGLHLLGVYREVVACLLVAMRLDNEGHCTDDIYSRAGPHGCWIVLNKISALGWHHLCLCTVRHKFGS